MALKRMPGSPPALTRQLVYASFYAVSAIVPGRLHPIQQRALHRSVRSYNVVSGAKRHLLPEFSLKDKVVVVSGGARGLGLVQAEALLEAGATGMHGSLVNRGKIASNSTICKFDSVLNISDFL